MKRAQNYFKQKESWSSLLMMASLVILALALSPIFIGAVSAQTLNSTVSDNSPAPMVIEADDAGNVVMRGEVTAINGSSMSVESWGGTWTVRTNGESSVVPVGNGNGDLSGISVGDFVGVDGVFATDQDMTVDASFVRNWTTDPVVGAFDASAMVTTDMTIDSDAGSMIMYSGTVDEVDDSSFTFTDDFNSTYAVFVGGEVGVVNNDDEVRSFDDIDAGDQVELDGTAIGDFVTTSLVRITSE